MFTRAVFDSYQVADPYNETPPNLRLSDLKPVDDSLPVRLSIFISVNSYRRAQLGRCLETLARQNWREFEVLVADNEHPQDLGPMLESFEPYLRLRHIRVPRKLFRVCPSHGFKAMMPMAKGEVWAITQADIMFDPNCAELLWRWHYEMPTPEQADRLVLADARPDGSVVPDASRPIESRPRWVNLKPYCLSASDTLRIDRADWHTNVYALRSLPNFWILGEGLGGKTNEEIDKRNPSWPWWMTASCKADDRIWQDIPLRDGHALLDMFLISYRYLLGYVDLTPAGEATCFHQRHADTPIGPLDEADVGGLEAVREYLQGRGYNLPKRTR